MFKKVLFNDFESMLLQKLKLMNYSMISIRCYYKSSFSYRLLKATILSYPRRNLMQYTATTQYRGQDRIRMLTFLQPTVTQLDFLQVK